MVEISQTRLFHEESLTDIIGCLLSCTIFSMAWTHCNYLFQHWQTATYIYQHCKDKIYDGPASYHVQYVKLCHLSSVAASRISFADMHTSAVRYQYSHVTQVLKRPHCPHLLCYQLIFAVCMHTCSLVSVSTHTSLSHFFQGAEPELCKLRER